MQESACFVYDFTTFEVGSRENVIKILKELSKKWVFQLEKCPSTGNLHFQGRMSLKDKARYRGLQHSGPFNLWKLSPTSTDVAKSKNFDYVMKEETRVEGPWSNKDKVLYIPRDVREIGELYPWQKDFLSLCGIYNKRTVYVIYDPEGNKGKSTIVRLCGVHGYGRKLPFCNSYEDIMQMAMSLPEAKNYFFDMPRAINKEKLYQLYAGIEELKGGYCFDKRYKFEERFFDPPNIFVFTNKLPDESMLSKDRWLIFIINNLKLEKFAGASL